ncbi:hypothetical protein ONA70_12390 [Micromonospora yasonensis]|uniref:hypothetical protein n=1 Tax=Micromonospora yasonensis TaxID=1128667 RepID=UPI00223076BB|nr:hypothetical protein [Micromonospora yasonensis]MCW3840897.1 hypothetical protein [Micromonospora yasonensis]
MAEEELTQTGIRVGGWLPAVPGEPGREPGPPAVPRRLPANPQAPVPPTPVDPEPAGPAADHPFPAQSPVAAPPDDLTASTDEATPGGGADPGADAGGPQQVPASPVDTGPARHSAPESMAQRLAGLVGPAAAKLRVAVGAAPDGPVTRVGAARARRRRRRVVVAAAALAALVVALAYADRGARPGGPAPPAALPTAAAAPPAPAPSPTVVPVTGNPALPGGPLLSVDQQPVPALVDLTALGVRDWVHWGGLGSGSVQRKQVGTGEITDPGGVRLEHAASVSAFAITWRALAVVGGGNDGVTMEAVTVVDVARRWPCAEASARTMTGAVPPGGCASASASRSPARGRRVHSRSGVTAHPAAAG